MTENVWSEQSVDVMCGGSDSCLYGTPYIQIALGNPSTALCNTRYDMRLGRLCCEKVSSIPKYGLRVYVLVCYV